MPLGEQLYHKESQQVNHFLNAAKELYLIGIQLEEKEMNFDTRSILDTRHWSGLACG